MSEHHDPSLLEAQRAVDELCNYLLGEHWYIVDPVSNLQANAIILAEIKNKYPPADAGFIERIKWRFGIR